MKILVTGATGFIGTHLLPRLLQDNHQIVAAVRNEASATKLSVDVPHVCIGEIDGNTNWNQALVDVDAVVHLAGRAHILQEVADAEAEFQRVNVVGTINLVQQALTAGVQHFIFISSIGAVATLSNRALSENTPPQPDTAYGKSKLAAETALRDLTQNASMNWTILRPTLVYGEGNPGNMASLIKLIKLKLPLPFKSINNRRSFLYVGNLVDAIAVCLTNSQAQNKLFLISDTQTLSTPQLIRQIAASLNSQVTLIPLPLSLLKLLGSWGDLGENLIGKSLPINSKTIAKLSGSLAVDNSYICHSLNWKPPYTVEQGFSKSLS